MKFLSCNFLIDWNVTREKNWFPLGNIHIVFTNIKSFVCVLVHRKLLIQQEAYMGILHICTMKPILIDIIQKIMKIPQCFLSPVFSTSQWQLPFQKENPSGNLATRIVSLAFIVIPILLPFFKSNARVELKLSFQSKIDLHKQNEPSDLDVYSLVLFSW